jgi:hypothetical protein
MIRNGLKHIRGAKQHFNIEYIIAAQFPLIQMWHYQHQIKRLVFSKLPNQERRSIEENCIRKNKCVSVVMGRGGTGEGLEKCSNVVAALALARGGNVFIYTQEITTIG